MRLFLLLALGSSVPAIAQAEPPIEKHATPTWTSKWMSRLTDPKLAFGGTLLFGGYAGSLLWAQQGDSDHAALYVPLLGPWLELLSLPACGEREMFCEHDDASRGILIASGATQLIGTGLIIYALTRDGAEHSKILITPSMSHGNPGVVVRGRF